MQRVLGVEAVWESGVESIPFSFEEVGLEGGFYYDNAVVPFEVVVVGIKVSV